MPPGDVAFRPLVRAEVPRIWTIDRREWIENLYELVEGALALRPHRFQVPGWPPGHEATVGPRLADCFDRGGWSLGAFAGERLVGVAVLDPKPIGPAKDQLQLDFLHVGQSHRGTGVGLYLFEAARAEARARGAHYLYVSATPSENTVNFYLRRGCELAQEPDPELFALEPEDIHLLCRTG